MNKLRISPGRLGNRVNGIHPEPAELVIQSRNQFQTIQRSQQVPEGIRTHAETAHLVENPLPKLFVLDVSIGNAEKKANSFAKGAFSVVLFNILDKLPKVGLKLLGVTLRFGVPRAGTREAVLPQSAKREHQSFSRVIHQRIASGRLILFLVPAQPPTRLSAAFHRDGSVEIRSARIKSETRFHGIRGGVVIDINIPPPISVFNEKISPSLFIQHPFGSFGVTNLSLRRQCVAERLQTGLQPFLNGFLFLVFRTDHLFESFPVFRFRIRRSRRIVNLLEQLPLRDDGRKRLFPDRTKFQTEGIVRAVGIRHVQLALNVLLEREELGLELHLITDGLALVPLVEPETVVLLPRRKREMLFDRKIHGFARNGFHLRLGVHKVHIAQGFASNHLDHELGNRVLPQRFVRGGRLQPLQRQPARHGAAA